jgi:hypothetical protein
MIIVVHYIITFMQPPYEEAKGDKVGVEHDLEDPDATG